MREVMQLVIISRITYELDKVNGMDELLTKVKSYLPPEKVGIVEEAYAFAMHSHDGQTRLSGEPYVVHPVQAAMFLADLNLDASTIAATLLHDVIEDCGVTYQDL